MARLGSESVEVPSAEVAPPPVPAATGRRARRARRPAASMSGWLFAAPAILFYAASVQRQILVTVQYSLYEWDGIGPSTWVGAANYGCVSPSSSTGPRTDCRVGGR